VPRHLGAYQPENYDHAYRGVMSAAEALRVSRNVPAVALTAELRRGTGRPLLYELLRTAGVESINRSPEHYGLALVLGGGDLTLLELANLYAALARQGRHARVRTVAEGAAEAAGSSSVPTTPGRRLFSAASAYMVLDILTTVERPELAPVWRSGTHHVPVPWKTGTSYGHRDAWSIGIAGNYVVAVWIGNFDGRGVPELVGAEVAAPLLFDLIGALPRTQLGDWHRWPRGLDRRRVCSVSGAPPNRFCTSLIDALYRPGVSPAATCAVHREIQVDTETHDAVCSRCRIPGRWRSRVVAWWPSRTARLLRTHQLPIEHVPPHNPSCTAIAPGAAPAITSPQEGVSYALRSGVPAEDQQVALAAAVGRGSHQLYWFIDGSLFWQGAPGATVFWQPRPGHHQITVKDDAGRNATRTIHVVAD
jgi:penicillin-binding protein 1C